jgi:9-cis-beta-carotene 9',10'-cleaving dioxygenase
MLSTACKNTIPPNLLPSSSPLRLPLINQVTSPSKLTPRAISIPSPQKINHAPPTHPSDKDIITLDDDSMAAYWDYQFLFVSQRSETGIEPIKLRVVDGAIPLDFPHGTYYLTGPGLFSDDYGSTVHPLDGHGYLRAFTFDDNEVKFMARYVKTEAQVEEHDPVTDTWRFTHRGPFSVLKNGKRFGNTKVMKNVANTSVLKWGGKLLCLWEGGDPYEIEPETLDTVGKFDMIKIDGCDLETNQLDGKDDGAVTVDVLGVAARLLKPILHGIFKMPAKRLLSHYKLDVRKNRLLTMSCNAEDMLLPRSNFVFYEFDSKFELLQKQEYEIPDHLMVHDWAFTDSYYILFGNRIKLDVIGSMAAVCGLSPMISALKVNPSKSNSPIYLLPRFPKSRNYHRDWRVPMEVPSQMWLIHVGNSFEIRDDCEDGSLEIQIHASACSYQWFNFPKLFGYDWKSGKLDPSMMNIKEELLPRLVQVSINLDANENIQKCKVKSINQWTKTSDFPIINPMFTGKESLYIYAATSSGSRRSLPHFPFDSVMKLNRVDKSTKTWSVGSRRFIGEPIFVPKGVQEDDGYLLVIEYAVAIQMCYLVILDATKIGDADALVARLEVPKSFNFPFGFHGFWAPK